MTKCTNCGAEFEGEVCPSCGNAYDNPTAEEAANFLPPPSDKKLSTFKSLAFYYLNYIPSALFVAFTVMFTIFNFTPAAVSKTASLNMFTLAGAGLSASGCSIFLIICWALSLIGSGICTYLFISRRYNRLSLGETQISLHTVAGALLSILLLIIFITSCVAVGTISDGLYRVGSSPVLTVIFSIIFLILIIGAILIKLLLANKYPALADGEAELYLKRADAQRARQLEKINRSEEKKRLVSEYIAKHPYPEAVAKPDKKLYLTKLNQSQNDFYNRAKRGQNLKKQVCFSTFMLFINICLWLVVSVIAYCQVNQTAALDGTIFAVICAVVAAASVFITVILNKLIGYSRPNKIKKCCAMRPLGFFSTAAVIMALVSAAFAAGGVYLYIYYTPLLDDGVKLNYQIALIISAALFVLAFICCVILIIKAATAKRRIKKIRVTVYGTSKIENAAPIKTYEELFPEYAEYLANVEAYDKYLADCKNHDKTFKLFLKSIK